MDNLITLNYFIAAFLGFGFLLRFRFDPFTQNNHWFGYATILGILFILMFYLIGYSSQKAGIAVTTLANKISLVFPVLFSLLYFGEKISALKYAGLTATFVAVIFTLYKKDIKRTELSRIVLPLLLFAGSGLTDSLIKYVQATRITPNQVTAYTTLVFFVAFVCGFLFIMFKSSSKRITFRLSDFIFGTMLGLVNFGSLYFIIRALNQSQLNSSLVFALNNMAVVALSALIGAFVFREKLNKINIFGIALAIVSLYILLK